MSIEPSERNAAAVCRNWSGAPVWKHAVLTLLFIEVFLLVDGYAAPPEQWEGAPTWYPPATAFLVRLARSDRRLPAVCDCDEIAARRMAHRCGIETAEGRWIVRACIVALRSSMRGDWDVTLLGDGLLQKTSAMRTVVNWWESDAISLVSFAPLLLVHLGPRVDEWMNRKKPEGGAFSREFSIQDRMVMIAQCGAAIATLWIAFRFPAAAPFKPLFLLFIQVIWIALKHCDDRAGNEGGLGTFSCGGNGWVRVETDFGKGI